MKHFVRAFAGSALLIAAFASIAGGLVVCDLSRCYLTRDQVLLCPPDACYEIKPPKGQP